MKFEKSIIISVIAVAVLLIGGGVLAYNKNQTDKKNSDHAAMMKKEADALKNTSGEVKTIKGGFTSYDQAKLADAENGHVVLFFSASWCPTCKEANKNFTTSTTPTGLTLLKVDYDNSNELKKKYGVTYQHTYVQVDKDGNQIKKWSGSTSYDQIKTELQ